MLDNDTIMHHHPQKDLLVPPIPCGITGRFRIRLQQTRLNCSLMTHLINHVPAWERIFTPYLSILTIISVTPQETTIITTPLY